MLMRMLMGLLGLALSTASVSAQSKPIIDPVDFVEYWSAARVHLRGGNPYDGELILPLQQLCVHHEKTIPTMLWTPPWTLPLYWPSGALEPREAHLLWIATQVLCCLISSILIWLSYGGPSHRYWLFLPGIVMLFLAPVVWLWVYGQNTGFLLLGLSGFAYCKYRRWHYLAGVFAALTAIKPHFLALFGWALLLDAIRGEGRKSLIAGVLTIALAGGIALIPNPQVFHQFYQAITSPSTGKVISVSEWKLPLLSYQLRLMVDPVDGKAMGVGFLPLLLGVITVTVSWWRQRHSWDWLAALPWLIFGSALLAPYGGWLFDLVVLLFPMIRLLALVHRQPIAALLVGLLFGPVMLLVANLTMSALEHGWWVTPAAIAVYWLMGRYTPATPPTSSSAS